jgi:hypothetical protein
VKINLPVYLCAGRILKTLTLCGKFELMKLARAMPSGSISHTLSGISILREIIVANECT